MARTQVKKIEPIGSFDPRAFALGVDWEKRADTVLEALTAEWCDQATHGYPAQPANEKEKTEVGEQVARVVTPGRESGIPTPVSAAVLEVLHEIESGATVMPWGNLGEIEQWSRRSLPVED